MKQFKFRVADIPQNVLIHHYVQEKLKLSKYWEMPIRHLPDRYFKFEIEGLSLIHI